MSSPSFYSLFFNRRVGAAAVRRPEPITLSAELQLQHTLLNLAQPIPQAVTDWEGKAYNAKGSPLHLRPRVDQTRDTFGLNVHTGGLMRLMESRWMGLDQETTYALQFKTVPPQVKMPKGSVDALLWHLSPQTNQWQHLYNIHANHANVFAADPHRHITHSVFTKAPGQPIALDRMNPPTVLNEVLVADLQRQRVFEGEPAYQLLHRVKHLMAQTIQQVMKNVRPEGL